MGRKPTELPPYANRYLDTRTSRGTRTLVRLFHRWMMKKGIALQKLTRKQADIFLARPVTTLTRNRYRRQLSPYLDWLFAQGHIDFDGSSWLRVRNRRVLPPTAERFLAQLAPTKQPSTVSQYRIALGRLHDWLGENKIALENLTRADALSFQRNLYDRGQTPITRINVLVCVRVYLRDLEDRGVLPKSADDLIRRADFPKQPIYLPRPLQPKEDQALKARLLEIGSRYSLGLVLMRKTGLRIGELSTLPKDCLQTAPGGRHFLKVPLGKLQKERLVPLDDEAIALVDTLRDVGDRDGRTWLIETKGGARARPVHFRIALKEAAIGIDTAKTITSHRLRHTFATELVCAGMNLPSVMKLLGHTDYRMTLRYTEVSLEALGDQYLVALEKLERRYRVAIVQSADPQDELAPDRAIENLLAWLKHKVGDSPKAKKKARALGKRLRRIQSQLQKLQAAD